MRRTPVRISAQRFEIPAPRHRGTYRVRLLGHGPEGGVLVSFSWTYGRHPGRCS